MIKSVLKRTWKIVRWLPLVVLAFLILVFIGLNVPSTQRYFGKRVSSFLSKKTGQDLRINQIGVNILAELTVQGVFVPDTSSDTLILVDYAAVDLDFLDLFDDKIHLQNITLEGCVFRIRRNKEDSTFNFNYLVEAFSSDKPASAPKDTSGGMDISIDAVELSSVKGTYLDRMSNMHFDGDIGSLSTAFEVFDLEKQHMKLEAVALANINWFFEQGVGSSEEDTTKSSQNWLIEAEDFTTEKADGTFNSTSSGMVLSPKINNFETKDLVLDLGTMDFSVDQLVFNGNELVYHMPTTAKDTASNQETEDSTSAQASWRVRVNEIEMKNNRIVYGDSTAINKSNMRLDFSNFILDDLNIAITDLDVSNKKMALKINQLGVETSSSFGLKSFSGEVLLDSTRLDLLNNRIETHKSSIDYSLKTTFSSLPKLLSDPSNSIIELFALKGNLHKSNIDVFYDLESLPPSIEEASLNINLAGSIDDLEIKQLDIKSENTLLVNLDGRVKGLPELERLTYDFKLDKMMTNLPSFKKMAQEWVDTLLTLPNWIELNGTLKGTASTNEAHLKMDSELGKAAIDSKIDFTKNKETYDVTVSTKKLAIGKMIGQKELVGNTTFKLKVKGKYLDPNKIVADATFDLKHIKIKERDYKNGSIKASWKNKKINSTIAMKDKHMDVAIITKGKWVDESLTTSNDIQIDHINFKELNLSKREFDLVSKIELETKGLSKDDFMAEMNIKKGTISYTADAYNFAPSQLNIRLKEKSSKITLDSPVAQASFTSEFNIGALSDVIQHQISHYFDVEEGSGKQQKFNVSLKVLDERIFEDILVPGLEEATIHTFQLDYSSLNHQLDLLADIPLLKYYGLEADSLVLNVNSNPSEIVGELNVSELVAGGFTFHYPSVDVKASNDRLEVGIALRDEEEKQKFGLKGMLQKINKNLVWHTDENGLMLYYEEWKVSKDNKIVYTPNNNVNVNDFSIKKGDQFLTVVNSDKKDAKISFNNFTVENLTSIIYSEEEVFRGNINGVVELGVNTEGIDFESAISIDDFSYSGNEIGDLSLKVKNPNPGTYESNIRVQGANKLQGNVTYVSENKEVNGSMNLRRFELQTLKKFTKSSLRDLSGLAWGSVNFKGTFDKPDFDGKLNVEDAKFHVIMNNTSYVMKNFEAKFSNNRLQLNRVALEDTKGNKAVADGYVTLEHFYPNKLHFDVSMNAFPILNTDKQEDDLYYGNLSISSDLSIRGTFDYPEIDAKLKLTPGSHLTLVVPESELDTEDYKEVVEFVDFSKSKTEEEAKVEEPLKNSSIKGIQVNAVVQVNSDVTLKLIIDPIAGDYLELRGDAYLNYELSTDGQMKLIGVYTVRDGHYQMTYYNVIKRKFSIADESTVTWSGDPFNAYINIDAVYKTKASPLPLVQSQISQDAANSFKQSVPVNVVLNISEQMLSPKLKFDIELPNYNTGSSSIIKAKLNKIRNSESEMNKQSFSLLVLNRFIPDDPSQSTASNSFSSTARGSVSQLISDQFNKLAGNYIKSVNVNFNVESYTDYTTGEAKGRTDLEIELSKAIFDDRLVVTVGSDFNVEGNSDQEDLNSVVGNLKAEYLIDEDGQYRVKVYRQNEYAGVIDGNVTKTGLSFILTEEFKALFKNKNQQVKKEKSGIVKKTK